MGDDLGRRILTSAYTSIVLDASGFPVVSYYDFTNKDLRVLHCGDDNRYAGNNIATVDSTGEVGAWTSIVLDASGFPVISYRDDTNTILKVVHCVNANCN